MGKDPKPRKHPCPHCLTKFLSPRDRDRHVRLVHEKRRDHKCPHCNSRFGTAGDMGRHCSVVVHEKVPAHPCPNCPGVASSPTSQRAT